MRRSNEVINSAITKTRMMSLESMRRELKIEKNDSFIRFLFRYLVDALENINYSTEPAEFLDLFRIFIYIKPTTSEELEIIETEVANLKNVIMVKKNALINYHEFQPLFLDLLEKVELFFIETCFAYQNDKFKKIELANLNMKNLKAVVCDLVFCYHDYGHLSFLMALYPELVNLSTNNHALLLNIFREFLINSNYRHFYSKVLLLFIGNNHLNLNENDKDEFLALFKKYGSKLSFRDFILVKEFLVYLKIDCDYKISKEEFLKIRYNIPNININCNYSFSKIPVDMRTRPAITIDSERVFLKDDAFSLEVLADGTYELGLYITDASGILKGSPLDTYSFNHFSNIYTKDFTLFMLPEPLVYNFSLEKGLRRVVAFTYHFTPQLELIDFQVNQALINIRANLSYNDVSKILAKSGTFHEMLKQTLAFTNEISDSLGTIDYYHHLKELVRELHECNSLKYVNNYGNHIVTTLNVFLNNNIARTMWKSGLPFIYYNNDLENNSFINEQLKNYSYDEALSQVLKSLKMLYKASTFSTINTGHKGLGLDAYGKLTNPARLYPSLMTERMLIDLYVNRLCSEDYIKKYSNLEPLMVSFNQLQARNREFINEYNGIVRRLNR